VQIRADWAFFPQQLRDGRATPPVDYTFHHEQRAAHTIAGDSQVLELHVVFQSCETEDIKTTNNIKTANNIKTTSLR
jgi:hypothetical protein